MGFFPRSGMRLSTPFGQFGDICRMIKIEHSIFALPYAWAGAVLAARGLPSARSLIFLTIGMIAARSFAMAFNRLADLPFERDNPRIKDILEDLFYDTLNIDFNGRPWVRNACKYGDMCLYIDVSAEHGVLNVFPIAINEIEREKRDDSNTTVA